MIFSFSLPAETLERGHDFSRRIFEDEDQQANVKEVRGAVGRREGEEDERVCQKERKRSQGF